MVRRLILGVVLLIFTMVGIYLLGILAWLGLYVFDSWRDKADFAVTYPMSLAAISKFDRDVYIMDFVGSNDCYPGGKLLKGSGSYSSFGRSKSLLNKVEIVWKTVDDQKVYRQWVDLPVISPGLSGDFEFVLSPEGRWDCNFVESEKRP